MEPGHSERAEEQEVRRGGDTGLGLSEATEAAAGRHSDEMLVGVSAELDQEAAASGANRARREIGLEERAQIEAKNAEGYARVEKFAEDIRLFRFSGDFWTDMRALNGIDRWPAAPDRIAPGKLLPIRYLRRVREFYAGNVAEWSTPEHDAKLRERFGNAAVMMEGFWKEIAPGYVALLDEMLGRYQEIGAEVVESDAGGDGRDFDPGKIRE